MGGCFSKKKDSPDSKELGRPSEGIAAAAVSTVQQVDPNKSRRSDKVISEIETTKEEKEVEEEEEEKGSVKKETVVIKHRKSHDKSSQNEPVDTEEEMGNNINNLVRTSSCTKEEVDAILIQCGRLSRSNSSGKTRKYSGSKRSYDFDHNETGDAVEKKSSEEDNDQTRQHRQRHRSTSQGRRRTPSRERERDQQNQRSGSRERGGSSSGRRVSRSPDRRTKSNVTTATTNTNMNRPGKMVSVPATVSSNNNTVVEPATTIKRISVRRNIASPRSQSPARATSNSKNSNENHQQPSLSRASSRKADHSPYRRNPLSEIEPNNSSNNNNRPQSRSKDGQGEAVLVKDSSTNAFSQAPMQKPDVEIVAQGTDYKTSCREKEQHLILEEAKAQVSITDNLPLITGVECQKEPQILTRSRSSRRSRDLDINPETLSNPTPSYTALLLEDIQNFHQKNTPSFSLPPCVTKACSILEAVADLNSTTSSNLSEDRKSPISDQSNNKHSYKNSLVGKKMTETKEPFVESEVLASDDLTEPSFHKYVTVRRGGTLGGETDLDEQESSGSNSYVGGNQTNWSFSSSSWEPNSADSTDRWTSRDEDQRHALSGTGCHAIKTTKNLSGKKRDMGSQKGGNMRGRVGAGKGPQTVPTVAAAAST